MRVLFLSTMYFKPGKAYAGLKIHRQAVELRRRGIDVRVVCPIFRLSRDLKQRDKHPDVRRLKVIEVDGVPITYVPYWNAPLGLSAGVHAALMKWSLSRLLKTVHEEFPFEILHSHRLFPTAYVGCRIAQAMGVRSVASAVGSDVHTHPERSKGIRRRTQYAITQSDVVIAVSRALANEIELLGVPRHPVRVVYRGVDGERFAPNDQLQALRGRLGLPERGLGILTIGHLVRGKGIHELLEAFEPLASTFSDSWLAVIGQGPLKGDLTRAIDSRRLKGRVFLVGSRPHSEIPDWLNASDVFVLASHKEGLPNAVLEAMACGRPVVATDVGGVSEALENGVSGLLIPPQDVVALREALQLVLGDSTLRGLMSTWARKRILTQFSWARSTERLIETYESVLAP